MSARFFIISCLFQLLGCSEIQYGPSSSMVATMEEDYCNTQVYYCNPPLHAMSLHDMFR